MIQGLFNGPNRQAQDDLTTHMGEIQQLLKQEANKMATAKPEDAAKIRARMEELTFLMEATNKALEKLFQAEKDSHMASM